MLAYLVQFYALLFARHNQVILQQDLRVPDVMVEMAQLRADVVSFRDTVVTGIGAGADNLLGKPGAGHEQHRQDAGDVEIAPAQAE